MSELGSNKRILVSTEGYPLSLVSLSDYTQVNQIQKFEAGSEKPVQDITGFGDTFKREVVGQYKEYALSASGVWNRQDAGQTIIRDAYKNNTPIYIAESDIADNFATVYKVLVTKFSRSGEVTGLNTLELGFALQEEPKEFTE